jgi:UDP:flavonoid glycosyltransferase YjiC (YdhE family)
MVEGKGLGTVAECMAIAECLATRGHEVRFLVNINHANVVNRFFDCSVVHPKLEPAAPLGTQDVTLGDAALLYGFSGERYLSAAVSKELEEIDRFLPHCVVSSVKITARISTEIRGVPLASIAASTEAPGFRSELFPEYRVPHESVEGLNLVLQQYGLKSVDDFAELSFARSELGLAPTGPQLDPALIRFPRVHFVGALLPAGLHLHSDSTFPAKQGGSPAIIMYLNRGSHGEEYERELAEALHAQFDPDFRIYVLGKVQKKAYSDPGIIYTQRLPLTRMLSHAALLVSAGGRGGMQAAVLHEVPIVALPGFHAERYFNSASFAAQGAASLVLGENPPIQRVVEAAINAIISRKHALPCIASVAAELRALPGADGAARLVEELTQGLVQPGMDQQ